MPRFAVILPAAGSSSRFGAPKLMQDIAGVPVIARAVLPFIRRADTHQVLIAVPNDPFATAPAAAAARGGLSRLDDSVPSGRANQVWDALSREPSVKNRLGGQIALVPGGPTRAESVWSALRLVPADVEWVAVHDAARPLVSQDLIDRTLAAAVEHGAAAPAVAVQATIKQSAGPLPAQVERTVPRETLWALQTPQIARRETLLRAFEQCVYPMQQITDDLQLLELAGEPAWLVPGDERNIKITTPQDLLLAEMLMARR
jgi:2-C-methyl-D-erythritol 4-phosphate cytidylyltransferase